MKLGTYKRLLWKFMDWDKGRCKFCLEFNLQDLVGSAWNWLFAKNEDKDKPSSQLEEVVKKALYEE